MSGHELTVIPVPGRGAEDVVVDTRGNVLTGVEDGSVFSVRPDGGRIDLVGRTGGRPLGLELYDDRILVADAHRGLLLLDPATGRHEVWVDRVEGAPMRFCNNAAVGRGGEVWFSDSSTEFPIEQWKHDFVRNTRTGRLMCRRADGTVEVHLRGLAFANGVALDPEESFVAVAETAARRVTRLWLRGERAGTRDLLAGDLPGYPDNIATGSDGLIWVTIASPLDPMVDRLQRGPMWARRLATALPDALQPNPKRTARVLAYAADGTLVHDLQADGSRFHMVTGVREHQGEVWLGSLEEPAVAVLRPVR